MPWPFIAFTVFLLGLTGLFSLAVASYWRKLSEHTGTDLPLTRLRSAAGALAIVLVLLGVSCLWLAFLALDLH